MFGVGIQLWMRTLLTGEMLQLTGAS